MISNLFWYLRKQQNANCFLFNNFMQKTTLCYLIYLCSIQKDLNACEETLNRKPY